MADIMQRLENRSSFQDCPSFLISYIRYLALFQNRSDLTVDSAFLTLREFLQFVHYQVKEQELPPTADAHKDMSIARMDIREVTSVTLEDAEQFACFLDTVAQNSTGTIRRKITIIRVFYDYLLRHQGDLQITLDGNPFREVRISCSQISDLNILPVSDVNKLLHSVAGESAPRDKAIILLIATTGLMLREVAALNLDDLGDTFIRVNGNIQRDVAIPPACREALDIYLRDYRSPIEDTLIDKDALFVSISKRRRITPRCIQQTIRRQITAAGLEDKGYTPQDLRDTAAVAILQAAPPKDRMLLLEYLGYTSVCSAARFSSYVSIPTTRQRAADYARNSIVSTFGVEA